MYGSLPTPIPVAAHRTTHSELQQHVCELLSTLISALCAHPPSPTPGNPTPAAAIGRDIRLMAIHLMEQAARVQAGVEDVDGGLGGSKQGSAAAETRACMVKLLMRIINEVCWCVCDGARVVVVMNAP